MLIYWNWCILNLQPNQDFSDNMKLIFLISLVSFWYFGSTFSERARWILKKYFASPFKKIVLFCANSCVQYLIWCCIDFISKYFIFCFKQICFVKYGTLIMLQKTQAIITVDQLFSKVWFFEWFLRFEMILRWDLRFWNEMKSYWKGNKCEPLIQFFIFVEFSGLGKTGICIFIKKKIQI